jgi:hypothetical protein
MQRTYFVCRDASGAIVSAALQPVAGGEAVDANHADLLQFFGNPHQSTGFTQADADFVRVLEDLIDTLIQKNVLHHTDLPPEAQRKLVSRKGMRSRLQGALNILSDDDGII